VSEDRRVKGRSDREVRAIADQAKIDCGVGRLRPVNILRILRSGKIRTLYGPKILIFNIVDDAVLGAVDAKTEFEDGKIIITAKRRVCAQAEMGVGRDRMTLAHELGHGIMHYGEPLFRHREAIGATALSKLKAFESAEHQAKVFASAFLIHDAIAATLESALAIAIEFGVSLQAAELCFDRLAEKALRARSAERVRQISEETKATLRGKSSVGQPTYLGDICTSCRHATLIPISTKVLCDTCGFVGERFQDGDTST